MMIVEFGRGNLAGKPVAPFHEPVSIRAHGVAHEIAFAVTTPQPGAFAPPPPESLAPHFPQLEISELLGHGGMGAVYLAERQDNGALAVSVEWPEGKRRNREGCSFEIRIPDAVDPTLRTSNGPHQCSRRSNACGPRSSRTPPWAGEK